MGNRLTGISAVVDHNPITGFIDPFFFCHFFHHRKKIFYHRHILQLSYGGDMDFGNDQYMHRRLRIYIIKSQHFIIFINQGSGDLLS